MSIYTNFVVVVTTSIRKNFTLFAEAPLALIQAESKVYIQTVVAPQRARKITDRQQVAIYGLLGD